VFGLPAMIFHRPEEIFGPVAFVTLRYVEEVIERSTLLAMAWLPVCGGASSQAHRFAHASGRTI
jgi:hypothetical protein